MYKEIIYEVSNNDFGEDNTAAQTYWLDYNTFPNESLALIPIPNITLTRTSALNLTTTLYDLKFNITPIENPYTANNYPDYGDPNIAGLIGRGTIIKEANINILNQNMQIEPQEDEHNLLKILKGGLLLFNYILFVSADGTFNLVPRSEASLSHNILSTDCDQIKTHNRVKTKFPSSTLNIFPDFYINALAKTLETWFANYWDDMRILDIIIDDDLIADLIITDKIRITDLENPDNHLYRIYNMKHNAEKEEYRILMWH